MAEDPKPAGKKIHPAAIGGPAVAIGASLLAVFISTRDDDRPADPAAALVETVDANSSIAQPAQASIFGQDDPAQPAPPTPPTDTATAVSPDGASVSFTDETLAFSAALPPGPANDPILAYLRKDAQTYLAAKKAEARSAYDEFKKAGSGSPAWPWEVMITWEYTAKAGDVVSLFGSSYEFTGGAHGMTFFDTHIARTNGEKLTVEGMMLRGLSPATVIAICETLKTEKQERIGSATIYDEPIVCAGPNNNVKIEEAKLALLPSDQPNKFGGIQVHYQAYAVGAYAEGSYSVTVQQEVFAQDLKPEFKPLFAGKAPPPPPPT
jgi:Deacetylase PdaC